jgi:hypothetical protein
VQKRFHDLVVSTYGRGFYILDDITPLEQMAKQASSSESKSESESKVRLFTPRPAYRLHNSTTAFVNYSLKSVPKKPVEIEILDAKGDVIRKMTAPGHPGINRTAWDMRYNGMRTIALRTIPPEDPHIFEEDRFKGKDSRPVTHWGMSPEQPGPLAAPGKYTVRLTVDGESFKEPLEILIDPHSPGTQQSIEATLKMQLRIRDDVNKVSDMVNHIEWMRKQLGEVKSMVSEDSQETKLFQSAKDTDQRMQDVEYELLSKDLAASDDKTYISAYKVYYDLLWLNGEVGSGAGDVAGSGDYGPTDTSPQLLAGIEKDLAHAEGDYHELMTKVVPAFNQALFSKGMVPLAVTNAAPATGSQ